MEQCFAPRPEMVRLAPRWAAEKCDTTEVRPFITGRDRGWSVCGQSPESVP